MSHITGALLLESTRLLYQKKLVDLIHNEEAQQAPNSRAGEMRNGLDQYSADEEEQMEVADYTDDDQPAPLVTHSTPQKVSKSSVKRLSDTANSIRQRFSRKDDTFKICYRNELQK